MFQPLDGPSKQGSISVNASTPQRVKVDTNELADRKVVTIQPLDGKLWVYFGEEGVTPTASDLQTKGFYHAKRSKESYEAGQRQQIWILAQAGTVDVRFAERA
jgi:hypothetical protein